jgi:hypothetical protein
VIGDGRECGPRFFEIRKSVEIWASGRTATRTFVPFSLRAAQMGQKTGLTPVHTTFTLSHLGQKMGQEWDKDVGFHFVIRRAANRRNRR